MTVEVPPVVAPEPPPSTIPGSTASFDERWASWQAKGAAHDRAMRGKMAIAAPVLIVVVAVFIYVFVGR
jgi:hypothetical protein